MVKQAKQPEERQNRWVSKGSKVLIIAGNEKGRTGEIIWRDNTRAKIEGVNVRKRHIPKKGNTPGRIVEQEASIHLSNMRLCNDAGEPVKIKVRQNEDGKRELVGVKGGQEEVLRKITR